MRRDLFHAVMAGLDPTIHVDPRVKPGGDDTFGGGKRGRAFALALCLLVLGFIGTAAAQSTDVRPLLDRLDRLERDMNLLQRQVYRGTGPGGAPVAVSPPDAQSAVNYEVRFSQLEDQMRTLTGQIEEINYNLDQLKRRLDTLVSDVDQRLSAIERGGGAGAVAQSGPAAAAAAAPRNLAA